MTSSTKISLAATVVILAAGAAIPVVRHRQSTGPGEKNRSTAQRATGGHETPGTVPKRQRDLRTDRAGAVAAGMVSFAREMEIQESSGEDDGAEELEKRGIELQARLTEMDAGQLRTVISALRDAKDLTEETRQNMICVALSTLGETHPAEALALYSESAALLADSLTGGTVVSSTLEKWARQDPQAALAWMRANAALHPEITDDSAKIDIVAGAAEKDPRLAFSLIGEMGVEDSAAAIQSLVEKGKTPAQRTAVLDALREYVKSVPEDERADIVADSLEGMGRAIAGEGFASVKSWIAKAGLTPEESARFASGLSYFNTKEDTGRWIDWMADHLPEDQIRQNVDNLVGQWTQQDYLAAGKWLAATADGPAKQAAVSSYAGLVAEYEPKTAVQWALTLPPGSERDATLETIYQNWPKRDFAAAQAFAKEHGIQTEPDAESDPDDP